MQQVVILEDEADLAAQVRNATPVDVGDVFTVEKDLSARGAFDQGNQFQQGMTRQEGHGTLFHVESDFAERFESARVALADVGKPDH